MSRREKTWWAVLAAAVLLRLVTLQAYPLHDTTEARYAEIARLMLAGGDWIMPQIEAGVPFWGKPPLSVWLTAASFGIFGLNEFAARLPALLMALATAAVVFDFGRELGGRLRGLVAATILLTSALGFVIAGAVMTDGALLAAATLAMVAFWRAANDASRTRGYAFFAAIGLGLLAKGPIILVLAGLPVTAWMLMEHRFAATMRSLPWKSGALLALSISVPWYVLAEMRSPGFLEYFIVGEHWLRFVEPGWQGDLYGQAHSRPRGTIWLFAVAAALPWSLVALRKTARDSLCSRTPLSTYLVLWVLAPLVFFTLAGNILPTYVATALPAFALLLSGPLAARPAGGAHAGWAVPGVVAAAALSWHALSLPQKSQRDFIAYQQATDSSASIYYYPRKPYSADFYSRGAAKLLETREELEARIDDPDHAYVAIRKKHLGQVPDRQLLCLSRNSASLEYVLFEKFDPGCGTATANGGRRKAVPTAYEFHESAE